MGNEYCIACGAHTHTVGHCRFTAEAGPAAEGKGEPEKLADRLPEFQSVGQIAAGLAAKPPFRGLAEHYGYTAETANAPYRVELDEPLVAVTDASDTVIAWATTAEAEHIVNALTGTELAEAKACLLELWERRPTDPMMGLGKRIRAVLGEAEPLHMRTPDDLRMRSAISVAVRNLEASEVASLDVVQHVVRSLKEVLRA